MTLKGLIIVAPRHGNTGKAVRFTLDDALFAIVPMKGIRPPEPALQGRRLFRGTTESF
jgi:hypothetical protein